MDIDNSEIFIKQTELYTNRRLAIIKALTLVSVIVLLVAGIIIGIIADWALAVPFAILTIVALLGGGVSAIASGPNIGVHREFLMWRIIIKKYSFIRWEGIETIEIAGEESRPTLIIIRGKTITDKEAQIRLNPKNYKDADKMYQDILRRHKQAVQNKHKS